MGRSQDIRQGKTGHFLIQAGLASSAVPWNKGKLIGQKPPLKPKDIRAIRIHLQSNIQFVTLPEQTEI